MSRLISACRYYISQHHQVEARLLEELRDLGLVCNGPDRPRMLTPADVQRLAYLHCVIKVCSICIYPCESAVWSHVGTPGWHQNRPVLWYMDYNAWPIDDEFSWVFATALPQQEEPYGSTSCGGEFCP